MEEIESPTEHLSEKMHHEAEHSSEKWLKWSVVLSCLFAVAAAISGLQSGYYANEAIMAQIESSDQWSYYQAKGIKAMITKSQIEISSQLHFTDIANQEAKLKKYESEQEEIKKEAESKALQSKQFLHQHEIISRCVTLFQIAIAIMAIAVLTKRHPLVYMASGLGILGIFFLVQGWFLI